MAVNVNFNGRLGADCEQKTSSNGRPFIAMRIATDEFKNGNKDTAWLNVVDYSERGLKMCPFLKKGSLVSVMGIETIRQYQTKDNRTGFSRDVVADRIEFIRVGANKTEENVGHEVTHENTSQNLVQDAQPSMDCGTFEPPHSALESTPSSSTNFEDDDLPF